MATVNEILEASGGGKPSSQNCHKGCVVLSKPVSLSCNTRALQPEVAMKEVVSAREIDPVSLFIVLDKRKGWWDIRFFDITSDPTQS